MSRRTPASKHGSWIRPDKRLAIYLRDGMACTYCMTSLEDGGDLTLDHVLAAMLGGTNEATNLVTCCRSCNSSKRDLPMRAWFQMLRDRGVDTSTLSARIRRSTKRDITKYRTMAKQTIANRSK